MTGICGEISDKQFSNKDTIVDLAWLCSENKYSFDDQNIKVSTVLHNNNEQPAESQNGDVLIWICGEIYGYDDGKEYMPKYETYPEKSDAEYCARLYDEYGTDFIKGLNSNFAGVLYNRKEKWVVLFTDRLSARPIYYTTKDGSFIFSTSIQAIANNPLIEAEFDMNGLADFFKSGRVYGLRTVLKGVKQLHPGSYLTFDMNSNKHRINIYWQPRYRPKNRTSSDLVDEFTKIFKEVIFEQTKEDLDYGLMLSGGSDSRLIASMLEDGKTCFHMNESMNLEAQTARRVAHELGHDFRFLERDLEYYPQVLEKTSEISNFVNWFEEGHTAGFIDELRKDSDRILIGHYLDTIFGHYIPIKNFNVPLVGNLQIPFRKMYDDVLEFDKIGKHTRNDALQSYFKTTIDLNDYKNKYLLTQNKNVVFYGVNYKSINDFLMGPWSYYPLTNTYSYLMYHALNHTIPVGYPSLDNRIIDFALKMPMKHLLRNDIVNRALTKHNRELADIPHPLTGIPLSKSKWIHLISKNYRDLKKRFGITVDDNGAWADYNDIIRRSDFVEKKLKKHSELLKKCSFISEKKVHRIYKEHLAGKNHYKSLHPLLTFLENPITEKIILG